jgi:hypothetical protein
MIRFPQLPAGFQAVEDPQINQFGHLVIWLSGHWLD